MSSDSPATSPTTGTSLAAAATLNSALQHSDTLSNPPSPSPGTGHLIPQSQTNGIERRRSSVRMRLATMDPTLPAPGELAMSPVARQRAPSLSNPGGQSHSRQQSLSELHQEAEYEQEAHFNRLRTIIRAHQAHLDELNADTAPANGAAGNNGSAIEDTPNGSTVPSGNSTPALHAQASNTTTLPIRQTSHASSSASHPRIPHHRSREPSTSQHYPSIASSSPTAPSPFILPSNTPGTYPSAGDESSLSALGLGLSHTASSTSSLRDEAAFYQAETSMFTRENQMLRRRIRELEGQLSELEGDDVHPHSHLRSETSA